VGGGLSSWGAAHSAHLQSLLGAGLSLQSLDGLQSILGGSGAASAAAGSSMRAVQGTIVVPGAGGGFDGGRIDSGSQALLGFGVTSGSKGRKKKP